MSAQITLKERIENESDKGSGEEESTKGSGNEENTNDPSTNEGDNDPSTQESNNASIADKNAKAMTDLMWQEHPSMSAQKSAKTVFFEENAKGSPQKWGDDDDEDMNGAPQKNDEGSSDPQL
jgi:hypothetical protein